VREIHDDGVNLLVHSRYMHVRIENALDTAFDMHVPWILILDMCR
jgi:hypothetical protein